MMARRVCFLWVLLMMGGWFCVSGSARAQAAVQDSSKQELQEPVTPDTFPKDEVVLDVIEIKGKVEKPGVIIMPRRVEADLGKVELERSFEREVKEGVGEIPKPEAALRRVERVTSIKKTVEKKRK